MQRKNIPVYLDIENKNNQLPIRLLQGNEDVNLLIQLTRCGVLETILDTAKVTLVCIYGLETHYDKVLQKEVETNKGNYVLAPTDAGYNITVSNNVITIPVTSMITNSEGKNQMILHIEDGINAFTYNMVYYCDLNYAYQAKSTPDNLPSYEQLKTDIDALKADNTQTQNTLTTHQDEINDLANDMPNKANSDLSNVDVINVIPDGNIVHKKDGTLKDSGININDGTKVVDFPYSIKTLPNTLLLGENIKIHENGGFVENEVLASGKKYLMLDYENNDVTGTTKPVYWERGALQTKVEVKPDSSAIMNNVSVINYGSPSSDHETSALYLKAVTGARNFAFKLTVNGKDVAYYPSKLAFLGQEPGYTLNANLNKLDIKPHFSSLTNYNFVFTLRADDPINLLGNGRVPYMAIDMKPITRKNIALYEDIPQHLQTEFLALTDTPNSYVGNANKMVVVNGAADALNFAEVPKGLDYNHIEFSKSIGVEALNKSGNTISSGRFVMLAPKTDNTYFMQEITHSTGYHGELFGYLRNETANNATGYVELVTTIQTGQTGTSIGEAAYIGFNDDTSLATVQIAKKGKNAIEFGRCGVFGDKNTIDEGMAVFNAFQVQAENLIDADQQSNVAFYDNLPAVIDTNALFVHLLANIASSAGIIYQNLPSIAGVKKGTQVMVENKSVTTTAKVSLTPFGSDTIDGKTTFEVDGETVVTLLATNSGWIVVYNSQVHSDAGTIMVSQNHGDYRQGRVEEIAVAAPLNLTFDPNGKSVALNVNPNVYATKTFSNVNEPDFDQKLKQSQFYKTIWARLPQLKGVKGKYIEQQDALTADQFNTPEQIIHIVYQIAAEDQIIEQTLPPASIDKVLVIQMLYSTGILNGTVKLTPAPGDQFNGATTPYVIDKEGVEGIAFANINSWDFIPYAATGDTGIEVNDQRSNFFLGMKALAFGDGFTAVQDPNQKERVQITFDQASTENWEDTEGTQFSPSIVKSLIKDIEIHQVDNPDGSKTANLNIAPWVTDSDHNDGIHVCLGIDQVINSKFPRSKMYFSDTRVKGGKYVYADMQTKSFIIQDVDPNDDPNVSGGSTFIIALYFEPNQLVDNTLTQDGSIELEFVDDNDDPILNVDGNPMGAKIDYKTGEQVRPELYIGECKAKGFTRVHLKIKLDFASEEIITVGANTQMCIQSVSQKESSGIALLSFMAYTGFRLSFDTLYYGVNSLNLARTLVFDEPEKEFEPSSNTFGENLFFDNQTKVKLEVTNYHLVIKDNDTDLPIWSISKVYGRLDSKYISGKNYRVKATLTDKDNAFIVAMLEYNGTDFPAPHPKVLSYNNTVPVFTTGWSKVDQMFI